MQKTQKLRGTLKFLGDTWFIIHKTENWYTYNTLYPDDEKLEMLKKRLPDGELAMNEVEVDFELVEKPVMLGEKYGEFVTIKAKIIIP